MKGIIYKIISNSTPGIYIGSTTKELKTRFKVHKSCFESYLNGKGRYCSSFKVIRFNDSAIELLEECEINDLQELKNREGYLQKTTMHCINKNIAGRDAQQYYKDNKEKYKQYYLDNKESFKKYYIDNKDRIKHYQLKNKDKIKEYQKQYRLRKKMLSNPLQI